MISGSGLAGLKIYYINLDRSPERRERIDNELRKYGLVAERVQAVDGSMLAQDELMQHYDGELNARKYFAPLKTSEIACFLSHRKVLSQFIEHCDADLALILEDDAEFICDPKSLLVSLVAVLEEKNTPIIVKLYAARPIAAKPLAKLTKNFVLTYPALPPLVTVAQIFNKRAARDFLQKTERFYLPVDVAIQQWWIFPMQVLALLPSLVTHQSDQVGGSTITAGKRMSIQARLIRELSRPLYRLKVFTLSKMHFRRRIPFGDKAE